MAPSRIRNARNHITLAFHRFLDGDSYARRSTYYCRCVWIFVAWNSFLWVLLQISEVQKWRVSPRIAYNHQIDNNHNDSSAIFCISSLNIEPFRIKIKTNNESITRIIKHTLIKVLWVIKILFSFVLIYLRHFINKLIKSSRHDSKNSRGCNFYNVKNWISRI